MDLQPRKKVLLLQIAQENNLEGHNRGTNNIADPSMERYGSLRRVFSRTQGHINLVIGVVNVVAPCIKRSIESEIAFSAADLSHRSPLEASGWWPLPSTESVDWGINSLSSYTPPMGICEFGELILLWDKEPRIPCWLSS